jgi:diadenylate cyclase
MMGGIWATLIAPFRLHTLGDLAIAVFDIAIVYYVVYRALRLLRGTRALQMLLGLALVGGGIFAAKQLELTTLSWLLDHFLSFSIIFLIVIFQHDIRRALMRMGQGLWWTSRSYERTTVFEEVIRAAERMAHLRVGALIVIERDADLVDHLTEPGVEIGGKVTEELLAWSFLPDAENKLHDGAVIIKELRIAQAGAVLPLSDNARLDKALGTRHRAAIGVTEETDAVSVVVSEERGSISLCFGGNVARDLDGATLRKALLGLFQKDKKHDRQKERTGRRTQTGSHAVIAEPASPNATPSPVRERPSQRLPSLRSPTLTGLGGIRTPTGSHKIPTGDDDEGENDTSNTTTSSNVVIEPPASKGPAGEG